MNQERIEQLLKFKQEDPSDPFILYALATEFKEEKPEEAKLYFDILLEKFPTYIGTYYHAAALYAEHFDRKKADEIYQRGIRFATDKQDQHALRELQNAYTNFQFDDM